MLNLVSENSFYELKHESGATFKMRYISWALQNEIIKHCVVPDPSAPRGVKFLPEKEREIKVLRCLVDWTGVGFEEKPVPCTDENKLMLPVPIINWLIDEIDKRTTVTEDEKKN